MIWATWKLDTPIQRTLPSVFRAASVCQASSRPGLPSSGRHAKSQTQTHRAQEPKPTGVILTSVFLRFLVSIQNLSINCAPGETPFRRVGFLSLPLDEHTAKWLERASAGSRGKNSRSWRPRPHPAKLLRRRDFAPGDDLAILPGKRLLLQDK